MKTRAAWGYWAAMALLILFRLYLTWQQGLIGLDKAFHDDTLFLRLANHISRGEWLGPYGEFPLIKGPVYPMFIALTHLLGLPLLFAQHLVYALACLLMVQVLAPLVRGRGKRIFVFALALYMPMIFSTIPSTRVLRALLYTALTLLVLACCLGLLLACRKGRRSAWWWSLGMGLALSAFWLCREEGIWLLPGIALLVAGCLLYRRGRTVPITRCLLPLLLPVLMLFALWHGISLVNRAHYGVYTTCEMREPSFLAAYGALTRIRHDAWNPRVPVPQDARLRVYAYSPAFLELAVYLEGEAGRNWFRFSQSSHDLEGGSFIWALRAAAAYRGYHDTAEKARAYYGRLAREVNAACDQGKLPCLPPRASLTPPWHGEYVPLIISALGRGIKVLVTLGGFHMHGHASHGNKESLAWIRDMTHERLNPTPEEPHSKSRLLRLGTKKMIMQSLGHLYKAGLPILLPIALLGFLYSCLRILKGRDVLLCLVQTVLLVCIASRLLLLAFVHVSSFSTLEPTYLCSIYPLTMVFTALGILAFCDALRRVWVRIRGCVHTAG